MARSESSTATTVLLWSAALFRGRGLTHGRVWFARRFAPGPGATWAPSSGDAELRQQPLRQPDIDHEERDKH